MLSLSLFVLFAVIGVSFADTPANCTYEELRGKWTLYLGSGGHERTVNCSDTITVVSTFQITLEYPDVVVDQYGNKGFWTLIYNQGFEAVVNGRKYFAFSDWEGTGDKAISHCDRTKPGWSHNVDGSNWACYVGRKSEQVLPKVSYAESLKPYKNFKAADILPHADKINQLQNSWKAADYEEYKSMTIAELIARTGGPASLIHSIPNPAPVTQKQFLAAASLPKAFDWRNVSGVNYVSPIRDQGGCGSCYAFASMAMDEARIQILTDNQQKPVFSPQDIVECSEYSQGCAGGFPYLIGGKYAEDFGLVEEKCNPYKGVDGMCHTDPSCDRHYSTNYTYIGGYYGACNEAVMMTSLVNNGPIAVGFEVYGDFMNYRSGVYHHVEVGFKYNPFHITNHAVLVVGYGTDDTGVDFWIVKNSWGTNWGEDGFFRIRRGNNECNIETLAVESFPKVM